MKIKIKILEEQIAYLKSLDSKKKKRKFLLDCLLEEIESKNKVKFEPIIFKDGVFQTKDKNVADFLSHFCRESKLVEEVDVELKEIVSKQVDKLFKDGKAIPTKFCVKITDENKGILETAYCEFNTGTNVSFRAKYLHANSIGTYMFTSDLIQESLLVTTEEFLKYIGREDLIEKEDESEKIERCEVCQMFPKIEGSNKCESCHYCVKHFIETSPEFAKYREKPNYSTKEIELAKHNINQKEVGLYAELQSILKSNSFLSIQDAMKIEKAVLKYHEIAK